MVKFKVVCGGVIQKNDKVLLVKEIGFDKWNIPAGGVKENETLIDALKRELKEEINVGAEPENLIGIFKVLSGKSNKEIFRFMFSVSIKGEPITQKEHIEDIKWISIDDVLGWDDDKFLDSSVKPAIESLKKKEFYSLESIK